MQLHIVVNASSDNLLNLIFLFILCHQFKPPIRNDGKSRGDSFFVRMTLVMLGQSLEGLLCPKRQLTTTNELNCQEIPVPTTLSTQ